MKCYYCDKEIKNNEPKKVIAGIGTDNPVYAHAVCWDSESRVKRRIKR